MDKFFAALQRLIRHIQKLLRQVQELLRQIHRELLPEAILFGLAAYGAYEVLATLMR